MSHTKMSHSGPETIFALATAHGRAGVAVIRISGSRAHEVLTALHVAVAPQRQMHLATLKTKDGEVLDQGMVVRFAAPHSFTGEDVVELHLHGSRAVLSGVLGVLADIPWLRPAEAGEFTRRAFLNGKMDLVAAEGLADLIDAQTQAQRRQALRHMDGAPSRQLEQWRQQLLEAMALLEAFIDFPEEDIPDHVWAESRAAIGQLHQHITHSLEDGRAGERIRDGVSIAIIGAPNVGKSTLINYLARRDIAIVSDIAGTTRDVIETTVEIAGYAVTFADTAGIRDTEEAIEKQGVDRAKRQAENADLILWLCDSTQPALPCPIAPPENVELWKIFNAVDKLPPDTQAAALAHPEELFFSLKDAKNLSRFEKELTAKVSALCATTTPPLITQARHRSALLAAEGALARALTLDLPELMAEEMRQAALALGRLVGVVSADEILGEVFGRFCIGK